jgi:2'-5' RNA ligase
METATPTDLQQGDFETEGAGQAPVSSAPVSLSDGDFETDSGQQQGPVNPYAKMKAQGVREGWMPGQAEREGFDQATQSTPLDTSSASGFAGSVGKNLVAGGLRLLAPVTHPLRTAAGLARTVQAGMGDVGAQYDVGLGIVAPFIGKPGGEAVANIPTAVAALAGLRGAGPAVEAGEAAEAGTADAGAFAKPATPPEIPAAPSAGGGGGPQAGAQPGGWLEPSTEGPTGALQPKPPGPQTQTAGGGPGNITLELHPTPQGSSTPLLDQIVSTWEKNGSGTATPPPSTFVQQAWGALKDAVTKSGQTAAAAADVPKAEASQAASSSLDAIAEQYQASQQPGSTVPPPTPVQVGQSYIKSVLAGIDPRAAAAALGMTPQHQEQSHVGYFFVPNALGSMVPPSPPPAGPPQPPPAPDAASQQAQAQAQTVAEAAARAQQQATQAAQIAAGVPPPKPATVPLPLGMAHGAVNQQTVDGAGQIIRSMPPVQQPAAIREAVGNLAKWMFDTKTVVGPDGKVVNVDSQKAAQTEAVSLINAEIDRQNEQAKAQQDAQNEAAEQAKKVQEEAQKKAAKEAEANAKTVKEEREAALNPEKTPEGEAGVPVVEIPETRAVQLARAALQAAPKGLTGEQMDAVIRKTAAVTTGVRKRLVEEEIKRRAHKGEDHAQTGMMGQPAAPGQDRESLQEWADAVREGKHPFMHVPKQSDFRPAGLDKANGFAMTVVKGAQDPSFDGRYYHPKKVKAKDVVTAASGPEPQKALDTLFQPHMPPVQVEPDEVEEEKPSSKPEPDKETKPAEAETEKPETETVHKYGNTQADIPPDSDAGKALAKLRAQIDPADLMGDGLVEDSHITVRYGIKDEEFDGIRAYLEKQTPFEARLGKSMSFPPSEHSEGAAPIVVNVTSPDLKRMEREIDQHGNFAERSFPQYVPHVTVAYVKPEAAGKYTGYSDAEGKTFTVKSVSISKRDGTIEEVQLKGKPAKEPVIKLAPEGNKTTPETTKPTIKVGDDITFTDFSGKERKGKVKGLKPNGQPIVLTESGHRTPVPLDKIKVNEPVVAQPTVEAEQPVNGEVEEASPVEPKSVQSEKPLSAADRFKKAQQAKTDKFLDENGRSPDGTIITRRQRMDQRLADGWKVAVEDVKDDAAIARIKREMEQMMRGHSGYGPPANENHPDRIKYNALKKQLADGPKTKQYSISDGKGEERIITKTEYDYALSKEKPHPAEELQLERSLPESESRLWKKFKAAYPDAKLSDVLAIAEAEKRVDKATTPTLAHFAEAIQYEAQGGLQQSIDKTETSFITGTKGEKIDRSEPTRARIRQIQEEMGGANPAAESKPEAAAEPEKPAISTKPTATMSEDELRAELAEIDKFTHPLYGQLEKMGEDAFTEKTAKYTPEAQIIDDQIKPYARRAEFLRTEIKDHERKAQNEKNWAATAKRVAEAPVFQRRNGWEIVKDGGNYVLRDPNTKEEVYTGHLERARTVADESKPEAPAQPEKPAEPAAGLKTYEAEVSKFAGDPNPKVLTVQAENRRHAEQLLAEQNPGMRIGSAGRVAEAAPAEPHKSTENEPVKSAFTGPYPEAAKGETEAQFYERLAGREAYEVTRPDFMRYAAYEYLAGGERRDKLISQHMGTDAGRHETHERAVKEALAAGKHVPPEVLAGYPELGPKPQAAPVETPKPEPLPSSATPQEAYDAAVDAYKQRTPAADQNGYNVVLNGLGAYLEHEGMKPRTENVEKVRGTGASPLLWELSSLFHSPLAGAKGTERLEELGKQMDYMVKPSTGPTHYALSSTHARDTHWHFDEKYTAKSMRDYYEGEFDKDISGFEQGAEILRRKAEIVKALIGETDNTKAAEAEADRLDKVIAGEREYAQSQIAKAEKKEATEKAAEERMPITRAEHVRNLDDVRLKPKEAWNKGRLYTFKSKGADWISDGHTAFRPDLAAGKAGQKAIPKSEPEGVVSQMPEDALKTVTPKKTERDPMEFLGVVSGEKADQAYFALPDEEVITFNAHKVRMLQNIFGKDVKWRGKDAKSAVVLEKDGQDAAILMPMRNPEPIDIPTARKTLAAGGYKPAKEQPESEGRYDPSSTLSFLGMAALDPLATKLLQPAVDYTKKAAVGTFKELVRAAGKTGTSAKNMGKEIVGALYPAALAGKEAKDIMGSALGEPALRLFEAGNFLHGVDKMFESMPQDEQTAFIARWEAGEDQPNPDLQQAQEMLESVLEQQRLREQEAINLDRKSGMEIELSNKADYFPHRWRVAPGRGAPPTEDEQIQNLGAYSRRPFEGSKAFMKQQRYTYAEAIEAGAQPIGNPVKQVLQRLQEGAKFVGARWAWHNFKDQGLAVFLKRGKSMPVGFSSVEDKSANVWRIIQSTEETPTGENRKYPVQTGRWIMQDNAAKLLNNYLSKDHIRASNVGNGLIKLKNFTTEIRLAISAFHWLYITTENYASAISSGIDQAYNQGVRGSDPTKLSAGLGQLARSILAPFTAIKRGGQIIQYARNPDEFIDSPEGRKFIEMYPDMPKLLDLLFRGGLRWDIAGTFKQSFGDHAIEAWKDGELGKGIAKLAPWLAHVIAQPLFEHYIPRSKWSFAVEMLSQKLAQNSQAIADGTKTEIEIARDVSETTDNRFGEFNWDSLYLNNSLRTGLQFFFRSATWKLGSWRGLAQAGKEVGQGLAGSLKPANFGDNMAAKVAEEYPTAGLGRKALARLPELGANANWIVSMGLVVAMLGSTFSVLMTHKSPWEWGKEDSKTNGHSVVVNAALEAMHPRTGMVDAHGQPVRLSFPTGLKDYEHAIETPGHYFKGSMSDIAGGAWDTLANRDFYENYVYNPNDPITTELMQGFAYNVKQEAVPMSFANYMQAPKDESIAEKLLRTTGMVGGAPKFLDRSHALSEALAERRPHTPMTPEQKAEMDYKREHPTHGQIRRAIKDKNLDYLDRIVKYEMSYPEAKAIYDDPSLTPEERRTLGPIIRRKQVDAIRAARR